MPIRDWKNVDTDLFHTFHGNWIARLHETLMGGLLPKGYYSLTESYLGGCVPDVLTLARPESGQFDDGVHSGATVLTRRPKAYHQIRSEDDHYLAKQRRIVIRNRKGRRVVAVIEIVSRSNKRSRADVAQFVLKSIDLLKEGINLVVIDLLPPTKACPVSLHNNIWEFGHLTCSYAPPKGKKLSVVSYSTYSGLEAFLEPLAPGDAMPRSPLFLLEGTHVELPLEETANHVMQFIPFDN